MGIKMVRTPSDTPNINNTDDFIGLRYAYRNNNGYILNKGNECSYTINGSKFKINSGRIVIQGIECDIDANGVEIDVDNVAITRYYSIYLQVNLALNEIKIQSIYDTSTYPVIDAGDDLTLNTTGTARLELFQFTAINGVIGSVNKIIKKIEYLDSSLDGYNYSNGTIENRFVAIEKPMTELYSKTFSLTSTGTHRETLRISRYDMLYIRINVFDNYYTLPCLFLGNVDTGTCMFYIDDVESITVTINYKAYTLSVTRSGGEAPASLSVSLSIFA